MLAWNHHTLIRSIIKDTVSKFSFNSDSLYLAIATNSELRPLDVA